MPPSARYDGGVAIHRALLLIADIGGYTRFMSVHRVNLTHAQTVVAQLLEAILDAAGPFKLAKLEGDAAFLYAKVPDGEADLSSVSQQVARIRRAFLERRHALEIDRLCSCDACVQASQLNLKFVAHLGEVAEQRVKKLGIDQLLTGLYALPGFEFPATPEGEKLIARDILSRDERGHYKAACPVVELPRNHEKPNPEGLLRICSDLGIPPDQTLFVGDSVRKDVAVAKAVGALDCWAEYGTYVSHEYRERLDTISANAITRRHAAGVMEGDAAAAEPTHALSNFAQLLKLLG